MTVADVDTRYDYSTDDLDLTDDPKVHARCRRCYPPGTIRWGDRYVALCGQVSIWRGTANAERERLENRRGNPPPPGACAGCIKIHHGQCPVCGASHKGER